ncbi:hypothetical protein BKA67DRAFT_638253 [Truncatella angustata]|uniref:Trichothecene 3-O-acetyltransferase-like N-terminal domain-containing protein n=1 Tax=Truncatella angustata TaxID=152316 RepID=A0A9P8ZT84_9PEZI|nr:uncharacterized protein BKA67DRAFT_638253 [Truncatella angustata]KAH6648815.1 hypothetical protein BKA67DRAFT_638253 [Truncatella angustata]
MAVTDKAPTLLASEHVGPKGWIRDMACLELAEDYDAEHISSILKTAWASFKSRTPLVGVEAVPLGLDVKPAGMLKLQAYSDGEIEDFLVKDHRSDDTIPSFAQLQAQGFPNAAMDNEKLCLRGRGGEWPNFAVDRLATNLMQANLIKGGLLLNHLCFHAFGDATSMWKLLELFAEDVRKAQGLSIERPAEIPTADRAKLSQSTGKNVCSNFADQHKEFIHIPFTPEGLPEGLINARHHAHVFRFTPESIQALKAECAPSNVRVLKDQIPQDQLPAFISTNDALTALLWKSVQRAENPDYVDPDSNLAPSVVMASLADLACLIRMGVAKCGSTYFDEVAHYIENMDDVNRLAGTAFLDMPGKNVLQSNWNEYDYYGIEWGSAFGDHIKALRFPAGGVCAGFQIIMPNPPNTPRGTTEVLVDILFVRFGLVEYAR